MAGDNVKSAEGCCAACNEWNLQHTADFQCNAWTWKAPPDDLSGCGVHSTRTTARASTRPVRTHSAHSAQSRARARSGR